MARAYTQSHMNTISEIENLREVIKDLQAVQAKLDAIKWSPQSVASEIVGAHVVAMEQHIDNAAGRTSTLIDSVRTAHRLALV